jgi:division protein CdvB (Snf7/Vps24/ESCRT-III family)
MNVTDVADEVQETLLVVVQIVQANVVGALEAVAEQAQRLLPEYAVRLANRLPNGAAAVDHSFVRAERWLGVQRRFAAGVGDALAV